MLALTSAFPGGAPHETRCTSAGNDGCAREGIGGIGRCSRQVMAMGGSRRCSTYLGSEVVPVHGCSDVGHGSSGMSVGSGGCRCARDRAVGGRVCFVAEKVLFGV